MNQIVDSHYRRAFLDYEEISDRVGVTLEGVMEAIDAILQDVQVEVIQPQLTNDFVVGWILCEMYWGPR